MQNLLQREGFGSLEAVKAEGRTEGLRLALRQVLAQRRFTLSGEEEARVEECSDLGTLKRWLAEAVVAGSTGEALR